MLLQKVLEGDPAMTLIQLDVKRGNVSDIVNDSIRSSYQVSDVIDMKEDQMNPSFLTVVLSEERAHVYQFQTAHDLAVFRSAVDAVGSLSRDLDNDQVIVPQKLFIMKTRNSFFPANTVCLTDGVSDYDDIQHTIHLQAGGREFHFKGMSQQDAQGWSQALATACVLKYQAQPLTEEILIQEQQRAEDMLQAASAGIAPTAVQSASDANNTLAAATNDCVHKPIVQNYAGAAEDSMTTNAAYLSKMQMLRELGFLPDTSAEAEALARSQEPASTSQQAVDLTAGVAALTGSADQQADEAEQPAAGPVPKAKVEQRSPEERAAIARSKGWAPRPLPQPKLQPTADNTAADNAATPVSATSGSGTGGAAVLPLPWRVPGLHFTSAPTVEDDEGVANTRQAGKPEEEQKGMVTEQDQESLLQPATADVPSVAGHNTAATTAQSAGQPATSEDDLVDTLLDDGNQSEWEARADFSRRLSMLPRDSFLELGMGNDAQAEWEARALWSVNSSMASWEQPLQSSSLGLLTAGPLDPFSASSYQLGLESSQHDKDVRSGPASKWADSPDALDQAGAAVQQPATAKAAAAAALQRALSNIHFIATGSQKARAAAAAADAAAAAASPAVSDNAALLQPGSTSLSDTHTAAMSLSEAAAVDSSNVLTAMSTGVNVKAGRSLDSNSVSIPLYSSSLADSASVPWSVSALHDADTLVSVNSGACRDDGGVAAAPSGSTLESMHHELHSLSQKLAVNLLTGTEQPQLGMESVSSSAGQAPDEQKADSGQQADDGQQADHGQQGVYAMQPNNGPQIDQGQQLQSPPVPSQLHMLGQSSLLFNQAASEQPADHSLQLQTRAVSQLDILSENTADYEDSRVRPAASGAQAVLDFQPLSLQSLLGLSLLEQQQPQPEPRAALSMAQQPARDEMQVQGASLQSQFHPPDSSMGQQGAVANEAMTGLSCTGSVHSDGHADRLHPARVHPAATSRSNGGDDLLTSPGFAAPSWQGLPSVQPTSSDLNSMAVKQGGDRAFDGWSASASTQLDTAHKDMLTAVAAQLSWHPAGHTVSRLLGRSTLQACSSSHASGLLPPAANARCFTEQPGHSWDASGLRGPDAAHSLGMPQDDLQWPQRTLQQAHDRLQWPQGILEQPLASSQCPSQGTVRHSWHDSEASRQHLSKQQALASDSSNTHTKLTGSWTDSSLYAQAGMHSLHGLKSSSLISESASPSLQAYSFVPGSSDSAMFNSKPGNGSHVAAPMKNQQQDPSSFLISTRYSEQPNAESNSRQAMTGLGLGRSSLQMGYSTQQSMSQQQRHLQQSHVSGFPDDGLYSAVSVQPRELRPSLLAAETARTDPLIYDQAIIPHDGRSGGRESQSHIRRSPVAAALSDSPWDDQPGSLMHQATWHLPKPLHLHSQQQHVGQSLSETRLLPAQQHDSWSLQVVSGASSSDLSLSGEGLLLHSRDGGQHGLGSVARSFAEDVKEHNDSAGAHHAFSASVEGLEMGDTGVVPAVQAVSPQVAATWQQQMQTDSPLAYQDVGPTATAEQQAGSSSSLLLEERGASAEPAYLQLGQETLSEQGMSAVTPRASAQQDAPVERGMHIMGKAIHQELAPASGLQVHCTEVISRQSSWEGPHGRLRSHSLLAKQANPEQADSASPGKEELSMPTVSLDSCQTTSSPSRPVLDSAQPKTATPLAAASGAANVSELCALAPKLVQTQAQPQPVFTGPPQAPPPPPPPPPPPQSRLYLHLQTPSSGPAPPPQTCPAAAAPALRPAFMAAQATPAMSAQALSVMSPHASMPLLQDSSAQTPLSASIATRPAATAGFDAVGHGVPVPQAMEDVLTAEGTLSAATALANLTQPDSHAATAALAAGSTVSPLQPGLPLTGNGMSSTCGLSTLPLIADPIATALPLRVTPAVPALADPSLLAVQPVSPVAVASVDPVVTATAATVTLSASAGQSSAATAVLPEAVVSMMPEATASIQAATASLSAAAHEHKGQVTGGDLLYDHLASVLATAPATCNRALTFSPPCHSRATLVSEYSDSNGQQQLPNVNQPVSSLPSRSLAAHDDARQLLLQRQTALLVPKQKAMPAENTGVSAHGVALHREVISQGDDTMCSEHAPTAEPAGEAAAAQNIGGSSGRAKGIGDLPNAGDKHAASIQAAAAVASSSPETAAAIVSTSDTILSDLYAPSLSVTMSMPEQSRQPWHNAAQQQGIEDTETPAAPQGTGTSQQQSADSAAAPPFLASSDTAHASTHAQAAPALALQGSANARQHQDATVGADATAESAAELGQCTPGLPGLSAADVRQLMRLMQSMKAAATWPKAAPADQMTTEQRLPAEAAPAEAPEMTAMAYQMQAYSDSTQLQGHQLREPSWCSSANQSGPQQLPTAAPPTPSMTKQSPEGTQERQTHAQLDVETLADAPTVWKSTECARPRRSTAASLHAGPAGLLRLKRQWRPISRQLRLSDSDDSDSLSDFNSIDDFHTEGGEALQTRQQAAACCLEPVVCSGSGADGLAVAPATRAEALQPAVRIQPAESGGRAGTSLHMERPAPGASMHLPLLPGIHIHVSMPPHSNAPSPSVLQSQPPQWHQDVNQHAHPHSTALQGGEVKGGVKLGQKELHQGRRQNGTEQYHAYTMQQPSLKQGMPVRQQGERCENQRKLTQQLSHLSKLSEVEESLYSTQGSLAGASHSKSDTEAQSCSSSWLSASEASGSRGNSHSLEPESPRPYPGPSHGRQGEAQARQGHPHRHQLAQAMPKRHREKWREAGNGAKLGDGRDQQAGIRSAARKPQGCGARFGEHQQRQMNESKAGELKQKSQGTTPKEVKREKHTAVGPTPHAVLGGSAEPQHVGTSHKADRRRWSAKPQSSKPAASLTDTAAWSHRHATDLQPADVTISAYRRRWHRHEQPAAHVSHGHRGRHHPQEPEVEPFSASSMSEQQRTPTRQDQAYMRKKQTHSRPPSSAQGEVDSNAVGSRHRASQGHTHASSQHRLDSPQLPHTSEALHRVSLPSSAEQCAIGSTAQHMAADTQQPLEQVSQSTGLHQTATISGPCNTLPLPHAAAATLPTVTGLSGTALNAEAHAAPGTEPDGSGLMAAAQEVQASAGLTAAAPGAGLHNGGPGPMQALMIALENMTKTSQTKLAAMGSDVCTLRCDMGEEEGEEVAMSPEASRRITSIASSVAEQVDRAVCAAVQAISPGRLPMSMTPHAYSQEVTEESHTTLVRNRLLQQMEASSTADVQHMGSRRSPSRNAQTAPQPRFADAEGCLQPPLRGSGCHHYLPSAGDGASSGAARARSHFRSWEAADDAPPEDAGECSRRRHEDIAGPDPAEVVCHSAHQQQSKRARLEQSNSYSAEPLKRGGNDQEAQHQFATHTRTDRGQQFNQDTAAIQQQGQLLHWMPVFCQMGGLGGYPGVMQGSPPAPWGQGLPNMPLANVVQGTFPPGTVAVPNLPAGPWGPGIPSMILPNGAQEVLQSYADPKVVFQPSAEVVSQSSGAANSTPLHSAQPVTSRAAAAVNSTASAAALACQQQQLSRKEPRAEHTSGGQSSKQTGGKVLQAAAAIGNKQVGIAACLPKLDKQLSHSSSEDLTARAVAKLWGVNLKRYAGCNS
ncbi:TPA: hypothetical protein ACH3X1_009959 [Trebouxia sp. C0004]